MNTKRTPLVALKRVYAPAQKEDGLRILVDRVWPRGMTKEALQADLWLKDAAPSTELRKWFNHDPAKWAEFRRRYIAELEARPAALNQLRELCAQGRVTLLFAARDEERNQAVVLKEYLMTPQKD